MNRKLYTSENYWQPITHATETSQWVAGIGSQFREPISQQKPGGNSQEPWQLYQTINSLWLIKSIASAGFLAVRLCFDPQGIEKVSRKQKSKKTIQLLVKGLIGDYEITIVLPHKDVTLLHYTTAFTPNQNVVIQAIPKDMYVLDSAFDPNTAEGVVYTQQHGPTTGMAYFSALEPMNVSVVYFQNLTSLQAYCQQTQSDPSDSVGVQWPEAGFTLPTAKQALLAKKQVIVSDAYIHLSPHIPASEFEAADEYLRIMAAIYRQLPITETDYYNWPAVAERTISDLENSPKCTRIIDQQYYLNAYIEATGKPPESMVQLAILVPLCEFQEWGEKDIPLVDKLHQSLPSFFDEEYQTIMRWLPKGKFKDKKEDRSEEQDANKIDSWYLLHTLMNLGRLAEKGDTQAKKLLLQSLEFVIGAAHAFAYNWPVFYDIRTLEVIKAETSEGRGGELDVAGLYTHVMLANSLSGRLRRSRDCGHYGQLP